MTPRYEVRAVWENVNATFVSQPAAEFDRFPMRLTDPLMWSVYAVGGGYLEDHIDRAAAESHAAQLNGVQS